MLASQQRSGMFFWESRNTCRPHVHTAPSRLTLRHDAPIQHPAIATECWPGAGGGGVNGKKNRHKACPHQADISLGRRNTS